MNMKRKRAIGITVLLASYTALLAGLIGLSANPIVGVLLVLGGMALSICTAIELVDGFGVDPAEDSRDRRPAITD